MRIASWMCSAPTYGVSWFLGNDYSDEKKLDIIDNYSSLKIGDGAIVLVDKDFNVAQGHNNGGISAEDSGVSR